MVTVPQAPTDELNIQWNITPILTGQESELFPASAGGCLSGGRGASPCPSMHT